MLNRKIQATIIIIVVLAIALPVSYGMIQRMAVTNLQFHFDKAELADVDFSQTDTINNMRNLYNNLENPSASSIEQVYSIQSAIPSEQTILYDLIANTQYTFNVYVDVSNPYFFPAVIDREDVKVSINGHELPKTVYLKQMVTIPAGGTTKVKLEGITFSGRDIGSILYGSIQRDYALEFNFAITSYYPTLFGEIPLDANIHVVTYPIPPKPRFTDFNQNGYNINSYTLSFVNSNNMPISGKMQVGVLKGNFLCNPACFAPIDNGLSTFLRIKGASLFDIQVFESNNYKLSKNQSFKFNIDNPTLRNDANSAFVIRWTPNFDTIPYTSTFEVAGMSETTSGEFHTSKFSTVRNVVYNLVRDFGYVGSQEFVSPRTESESSLSEKFKSLVDDIVGTKNTKQPSANYYESVSSKVSSGYLSDNLITNSIYKVGPGSYSYVKFTLPCLSTVNLYYSASALLGDDITVYVMSDDDFTKFQNNHSFRVYYQEEKSAGDVNRMRLDSGVYYIVTSNTYSLFSTKKVSLAATYSCD